MNFPERMADIDKLKREPNHELLWYKHGNWLIEQAKMLHWIKEGIKICNEEKLTPTELAELFKEK